MEARFKQDMERLEGLGTKAQIRNTCLFYLASAEKMGAEGNTLSLSKLIDVEARFKQDMERLEGLGTKVQIRNTGLFYLASRHRGCPPSGAHIHGRAHREGCQF